MDPFACLELSSNLGIAMVRHLMVQNCDFEIVRQPTIFEMHLEIVIVILDLQLCCMTDAEFVDSIVLMVYWEVRRKKNGKVYSLLTMPFKYNNFLLLEGIMCTQYSLDKRRCVRIGQSILIQFVCYNLVL